MGLVLTRWTELAVKDWRFFVYLKSIRLCPLDGVGELFSHLKKFKKKIERDVLQFYFWRDRACPFFKERLYTEVK